MVPAESTRRFSETLPESERASIVTFSSAAASSALTSNRNMPCPALPRTIAGVLTSCELLVIVNAASSSPSPDRLISQTAVPPATICRRSQRRARVGEVLIGAGIDIVIFSVFVTVPRLAVTVADPVMVDDVVNGKAAVREPAATVTETGRLRAVLVDCRVTTDALVRVVVKVTVHVPPRPGDSAVGEQAKRASEDDGVTGAVMVRVAVLLEPLRVAVMVGVWLEVTAAAAAVKEAVVAAAATVTEAGTVRAEVALLERATMEPPEGAALERATVQDVVEEAARVVLSHSRDVSVAGGAVMVRVAVLLEPLRVAVMVGVWLEVTAAAVAVKVAAVAADATVTEAGTVTAEMALLERATMEPPEGAALERVTVQVVVAKAVRMVLLHSRDVGVAGATNDKLVVALIPFSVAVTVAA